MRVAFRPLLALAVAGAALAAPAAQAGTNCVGPSWSYVCVITPDASLGERQECIYVGGSTCETYTIPWVETSGRVGYYCGGALACTEIGHIN